MFSSFFLHKKMSVLIIYLHIQKIECFNYLSAYPMMHVLWRKG